MTIDALAGGAAARAYDDANAQPRAAEFGPAASSRTCIGIDRVQPHHILFRQGEPQLSLFEILEGTVILSNTHVDGRRQVLDVARSGALLGVSYDGTYWETAEPRTALRLRRHSVAAFQASARLQKLATRQLCDRVRAMHELALLLGRGTATERISAFLMRVVQAGRGSAARSEPLAGRLDLTQADIADHLGLSIETVCRELSRMKREGLITLTRRGELVVHATRLLAPNLNGSAGNLSASSKREARSGSVALA